jgi:nucleoside-diphosphate-sugar epimerase
MLVFLLLFCFYSISAERLKVLVLGGSGFVGSRFIEKAAGRFDIVSVSRRGKPKDAADDKNSPPCTWLKVDATDKSALSDVFTDYGPFDACFHAIGLLLDQESGLQSLNKFASGSGSVPNPSATYDDITRVTSFNAIDLFLYSGLARIEENNNKPFVFMSAAEAGWTFPAPIGWLEKYLTAKRAVESKLLGSGDKIRPIIFRPSLIWTWRRPQALVSVLPFYVASLIKVPFVDRPTPLDSLIDASISAIEDQNESGIKRFSDIDVLARKFRK